ncbi:putative LIM domain only protein 7-like [Scophthalmus maximus]|uniref:Putative LIM domain only protein 7-like n=1 Tax=Scophthalmus maximus TaxID=52904 RepID=A0A2U9BC88_SCOMX|nr:putative LIM domain only protein 7-like [Scophthalmus maximus]
MELMEWRQQTSVSCADAFVEAQRWIQEATGKLFGCNDFRTALENGVLLCDLINKLKPGIIRRVNRLSTPIAGLDNVTVFLKACGELGLNESQLFHPGDLQDLSTRVTLRRDESNRRLKNVLITIYWLGRKAHLDAFYSGPPLNFKAFEGLLGLALSKALDDGTNAFVKDGEYRECWYPEREERQRTSYRGENSVDSVDSLDSRALRPNSEGCGSDTEAEQVFRMEASVHQNKGYIPPPLLRRKPGRDENGRVCTGPLTRSKSLSDIPMVYPVRKFPKENTVRNVGQDANRARDCSEENSERSSAAAKDSEAQWQDDLTKWKNRRQSFKTDSRRKSLDREHVINQMTNGAVDNFGKSGAQVRAMLKRDQHTPRRNTPAPRPNPTPPPSKSSSSDLRPRTRVVLARSYATEARFNPKATLIPHNSTQTRGSSVGAMPASDGNILGEETHFSSLASDGAAVTTPSLECPFSSQTQVKAQCGPDPFMPTSEVAQPEKIFKKQISTLVTTLQPKETTKPTITKHLTASALSHTELPFCVDAKAPTFPVDAIDQMPKKGSNKTSWEPALEHDRGPQAVVVYKYLSRTASWSGSASLPRGYRRSEGSSRLSSAITARPYGTKQSRVSSLPRLCSVDDDHGLLLNREKDTILSPPAKSSLKRQTAASHLRGQYEASLRQKKANQAKQNGTEQAEVGKGPRLSSQTSFKTNGYHHKPYTQTQILQKPYSKPQPHRDKSLTLPSAKLDHSNMRVSLTLKPNSIPDFGFQTHWDSTGARVKFTEPGSPAELCQLCVDDEIVAVDGVAVAHMNYNQWKDKMTSALQTGSLTLDIRRYGNTDWSSSEGSHRNQPGQSRVTLNLTASAPVLIGCPDHHANSTTSTETTAPVALKFNGQTDNVVHSKVMDRGLADSHRTATSKDTVCTDVTSHLVLPLHVDYDRIIRKNQKRRAEFFKQKGGSESAISDLHVPSLSPSSSSWSWDHEGDRRRQEKWQEEQERLLQEQYQRDQERLEAEWQRAQQDADGDLCRKSGNPFQMTNGGEGPASTQLHVYALTNKTREEEQSPDGDELKEAGSESQGDAQGAKSDVAEQDWAVESCGFAQLSPAHRAKSLSTPALAGCPKRTKGDQRKRKGQSLSKTEHQRQQILEEMKKRTLLLTDNSWIRQRSSSFYKEPVYVGVPVKRYESLDDLDALRQSPVSASTWGYPRPHSAAAGYYAPSRNASSRYSTGAILSRRNASMDPPHHGSVWAATDISEELKLESKFVSERGRPTVSSAISKSSMLVAPPCGRRAVFQITD